MGILGVDMVGGVFCDSGGVEYERLDGGGWVFVGDLIGGSN